MRKSPGQSLQEYALLLALVALVSVAALNLLGTSTENLISNGGDNARAKAGQLYAMIGASIDGGSGGGSAGAAKAAYNSLAGDGKLVLTQDAKTGQILIDGVPRSDTNATSIDGQVLHSLASQITQLNASPLAAANPQVQGLLAQLSKSAGNIAQFQDFYSQNKGQLDQLNAAIASKVAAGQHSGPPFYDAQTIAATVQYTDQYVTFSKTYDKLNTVLTGMAKTDPQAAAMLQDISAYAGGVTQIAHSNVGIPLFSNFNVDFANMPDIMTALQTAPAAAPLFTQLTMQTALLPPAQKEAVFSQQVIQLGTSMLVGAPVSGPGLTISVPPATTSVTSTASVPGS